MAKRKRPNEETKEEGTTKRKLFFQQTMGNSNRTIPRIIIGFSEPDDSCILSDLHNVW